MTLPASELKLWNEPQLRKYLGEVRRKCGVVETLALPSMRDLPTIQIETLFVPPLLSEIAVDADTPPNSWPSGDNLLTALQQHLQIVVLGDPGGGKTTLSNWLAWRLTSGANAPLPPLLENMLPIPCILRDMPEGCFLDGGGVLELGLAVAYKLLGASAAEALRPKFGEWIRAGRYVLILDGVDEIPVTRRSAVAGWMREANNQAACVLATSRIIGYEDYPVDSFIVDSVVANTVDENGEPPRELKSKSLSVKKRLKGYALKSDDGYIEFIDTSMSRSWAQIRYLMPFDQVRISDFARNWYRQRCVSDLEAQQKTSDLLTAIAQSDVTLNLARTPNLLSLMAIVHRERAHLPDGKALLYDEIVNAYLNTIDRQRKIGPDDLFAHYGWKERKTWLAYVGFKIQAARGWGNKESGILATEDDVLTWLSEAMEASGVSESHDLARDFLNWVARRSGLLLPRGENRYAFVHLSFQEYFCACYLESCIVRPAFVMDKLSAKAPVNKSLLANWARANSWTETLIFLFELLSAEHDVEWTESLLNIIHHPNGETARLSARLVKNKHVKLSSSLHDLLADGCVRWVYNEWDSGSGSESDVISTLIDSGHFALLGDLEDDELSFYAVKGISLKAWEKEPSRVRILIVRGDFLLSKAELQKMANLKALICERGAVVDVQHLCGLKKIEMICLSDVTALGIEHLGNHSALCDLRISGVDIRDLSAVSRLVNLNYLELRHLPITDITWIANCKKMLFLQLTNLEITDLHPLGSLRKVETLLLGQLLATDISFISSMKDLDFIQLFDMPIIDLSPLKKCKLLENIDLENLGASDISPLARLENVEGVFLSGMPVRTLLPLSHMPNLSHLYLKHMPVLEVDTLRACESLSSLALIDIDVDDIEFLTTLKNLKMLTLGDLPLADLSPLSFLENLTYIDIYRLNTSDVTILAELPSLRSVTTSRDGDLDMDFLKENDRISIVYRSE